MPYHMEQKWRLNFGTEPGLAVHLCRPSLRISQ